MTVTLTWWMVVGVFVFGPLVWLVYFHEAPHGDYAFDLAPLVVIPPCWCIAGTILVMKFIGWIKTVL